VTTWKKKAGGGSSVKASSGGASKELKALQEMTAILTETEALEAKLAGLKKRYAKARKAL
jgi:hypothetical protein